MRILLAAAFSLFASGPLLAAAAGGMAEFELRWPSQAHNSTHELDYAGPDAKALWVTGQDQDHVARVTLDGVAEYFAMPKGSGPHGLAFDGQGRLWVSLEFAGRIVRLDERGAIAETIDVHIHPPGGKAINPSPHGIAFGPDGRTLWFTGKQTGTIGTIGPDGKVSHFPLATVGAVPIYLAAGPDGDVWGTELVGNKILRVSADGDIAEFPIPTANSRPIAIVPGPDGRSMWFSEEAGVKLARIDRDGKIVEYPIPASGRDVILAGLTFDREGNLWTQMYAAQPNRFGDADYLVRVDKAIVAAPGGDLSGLPVTYYRTPSRDTVMHRIRQGPDGNLWFTELHGDRLGRLAIDGGSAK